MFLYPIKSVLVTKQMATRLYVEYLSPKYHIAMMSRA